MLLQRYHASGAHAPFLSCARRPGRAHSLCYERKFQVKISRAYEATVAAAQQKPSTCQKRPSTCQKGTYDTSVRDLRTLSRLTCVYPGRDVPSGEGFVGEAGRPSVKHGPWTDPGPYNGEELKRRTQSVSRREVSGSEAGTPRRAGSMRESAVTTAQARAQLKHSGSRVSTPAHSPLDKVPELQSKRLSIEGALMAHL